MEVWIGRDGERHGPYKEADVRQWLRSGQVSREDLAWYDGLADWQPLSVLFPDEVRAPAPAPAEASETPAFTAPPVAAPLPRTTSAALEDYAGFWKRFGAWVIDYLILMVPITIIAVILLVYLLLGSVMESFAVMVITVPIVTPLVLHLGYDVLWWGIINLCVVETGLIHPPLGLNVFVLKSIQPDVSIWTVYKGVAPFVVADLVKLAILVVFPGLCLWLVSTMGAS